MDGHLIMIAIGEQYIDRILEFHGFEGRKDGTIACSHGLDWIETEKEVSYFDIAIIDDTKNKSGEWRKRFLTHQVGRSIRKDREYGVRLCTPWSSGCKKTCASQEQQISDLSRNHPINKKYEF